MGHAASPTSTLTCAPDEPETIGERVMTKAEVVMAARHRGQRCLLLFSASTKNYNSSPRRPRCSSTRAAASTSLAGPEKRRANLGERGDVPTASSRESTSRDLSGAQSTNSPLPTE